MSGVNSQITEAIVLSNVMTIGMMPSAAMAMTYAAGAQSIGMVMHNAATTQHQMQSIAKASTTVTCGMIISKGSSGGG